MSGRVGEDRVRQKTCSKCRQTKPLDEFHKNKGRKDGRNSQCKVCKREADADYRRRNPNKNKEYYQQLIADNPDYWAERYAENRDSERERVARWQRENPDYVKRKNQEFKEQNPDYWREWDMANPDKVRERNRKHYEKKQATPRGKLENSVRVGVHRGITVGSKRSRRTFLVLGYTVDQLMAHLEKQFQPGMSWENYGKGGWHIDHIVPLSAHNYNSPDDLDFKRAWSLSNLQPLWERDNLVKQDKLSAPFQPSLAFGAANDNDKKDDEAA